MRPNDLALLRTPGVPTVSPDGRIAVVAVSRLDLDTDEYRAQLWAVATDGSGPARPPSTGLAFVSARHERADRDLVTDVHVVRADGTGLRRVTRSRSDCSRPVFDPTGRTLYLTAVPDLGDDGLGFVGSNATLCRVDVAGGPVEPLLDPEEHGRGDETPATVLVEGAALIG